MIWNTIGKCKPKPPDETGDYYNFQVIIKDAVGDWLLTENPLLSFLLFKLLLLDIQFK